MDWYVLLGLAALIVCFAACLYHLIRLIRHGAPTDFSRRIGNTRSAIKYSYTGAMMPAKKESAYLHLPTYSAGILYHIGTFVAIIVFFLQLFNTVLPDILRYILAVVLTISAVSGTGILLKRIVSRKLRSLSCADDYLSNILVTIFQYMTVVLLIGLVYQPLYFIVATALLLYVPVGKLRHLVYFFAARYQLGYFYGWRGSWPPSKNYPER